MSFLSAVRPMAEPRGAALAVQAQLAARSMRLQEFTPQQPQGRAPEQFPLYAVCEAIGRGTPERRVAAYVALQEFMNAPRVARRRFRGRLQEMVSAGAFPTDASMQRYLDMFMITGHEIDQGYEDVFQMHDVSTSESQANRSGFRLLEVTSGITFKKRVPGEPIQFRAMSGAETFVPYDMFGGGVSIEQSWWDDQDYLSIGYVLQNFRQAAYAERATAFYGLLTALSTTYNFSTGSTLVAKLNGACADILRALKGKGLDATPSEVFTLVYPIESAPDVDAALSLSSDIAVQTSSTKQRLQYRFKKVPTLNVAKTDGIYVCLPGRKNRGGIRMDLTLFGQFNISQYADDIAGWQRFGGALGEPNQIRRIPLS